MYYKKHKSKSASSSRSKSLSSASSTKSLSSASSTKSLSSNSASSKSLSSNSASSDSASSNSSASSDSLMSDMSPIDSPVLNEELINVNTLDKSRQYNPTCVRKRSNFSKPYNKTDILLTVANEKKQFTKAEYETYFENMTIRSPKIAKLMEQIEKLDERDMAKHGKRFKHFIFTDMRSTAYGAKVLASAFIANGYNLGYHATSISKDKGTVTLHSDSKLLETKYDNFYELNTGDLYNNTIKKEVKKDILAKFNKRPDNIYGELIRFIILDSGFKEGIDLFDIKYIHVFEPQTTLADLKQVIGRGTRLCGQKGLPFHPENGWILDVYIYDLKIPDIITPLFNNASTGFELYLKSNGGDMSLHNFQINLSALVMEGAVDASLTKHIHHVHLDGDIDIDIDDHISSTHKKSLDHSLSIKHSYADLKYIIDHDFKDYTWDKIKIENLCVDKDTGKDADGKDADSKKVEISYSKTQQFISHYFTPELYNRGMLLWHSVGTGKTCTAILTASRSFEKAKYTILWVTRSSLVNDIWKNMFGLNGSPICNEEIIEEMKYKQLPTKIKDQRKWLSNSWKIQPLTYRQFTNLVSKKNRFYTSLEKINGSIDPLRKTLIIIDEAHKLYGESDLLATERPNMDMLHSALMNSYAISKENSAKLLLMTATPITSNPMELIQLINLCKPIDEQLPYNYAVFKDQYLTPNGEFRNPNTFLNHIAGYVSYLDRSNDMRQFSQPRIHNVFAETKFSTSDAKIIRRLNAINKLSHTKTNKERMKLRVTFNKKTKKLKSDYKEMIKKIRENSKNKLNDIKIPKAKTFARKEIAQMIKTANNGLKEHIKEAKEGLKALKFNKIEIDNDTSKDVYSLYPYNRIYNNCSKSVNPNIHDYLAYDNIYNNKYVSKHNATIEEMNIIKRELKELMTIYRNNVKKHHLEIHNKVTPTYTKEQLSDQLRHIKSEYKKHVESIKLNKMKTAKQMKKYVKSTMHKMKTVVSQKKKQSKEDEKKLIKELKEKSITEDDYDDNLQRINENIKDLPHKLNELMDGPIKDKINEEINKKAELQRQKDAKKAATAKIREEKKAATARMRAEKAKEKAKTKKNKKT